MKAVVFDLDGTLIDSAPDLHTAANRMLRDLRRPPLALQDVCWFRRQWRPHISRPLSCGRLGGPAKDFDHAVSRFHEHYAVAPAHLTRQYIGVDMMLQRLTEFGFALGICTNKPYDFALTILEKLGIMRFIGAVVGGDTSPKLKPDPAPLLLCLDRLGVAPLSHTLCRRQRDRRRNCFSRKSTLRAVLRRVSQGFRRRVRTALRVRSFRRSHRLHLAKGRRTMRARKSWRG